MKTVVNVATSILFVFLAAVGVCQATNFTTLYSFSDNTGGTNTDGASPLGGLSLSGNTLYGNTWQGGVDGNGTIFRINTDGSGFTNLHSFSAAPDYLNADGMWPSTRMILISNQVCGVTPMGGSRYEGTLFRVNTDGTSFTNLHDFGDLEGYPPTDLFLFNNRFYSTGTDGGVTEAGDVFAINPDGSGYSMLYDFRNGGGYGPDGIAVSGTRLYGTAWGGNFNKGTIFAVSINGTGFTNLYHFGTITNDGSAPRGTLVVNSNILYGVTANGGFFDSGTLFKINIDGSGYTNFYSFSALPDQTNSDGAYPSASLTLSGNALYGITGQGGAHGYGTIFKIGLDGSNFVNLYDFLEGKGGNGSLLLSRNILYGTTETGGTNGSGTIYALALPLPSLNIQLKNDAAILIWSDASFSLQTASQITGVYTNIPGAVSPYTNTISDASKFFRLQAY